VRIPPLCLPALAAALLALGGSAARADLILGNLDGNYFSGYNLSNTPGTNYAVAQGFTMTSSYVLTDAVLRLDVHSATLALDLYADNGSNSPGTHLLTFTNPVALAAGAGPGSYTFTAPTSLTLEAGKTYWLDLHSTAVNDTQFDTWVLSYTAGFGGPLYPSGPGASDVGQLRSLSGNPPSGTPRHETPTAYQLDGTPAVTVATPEPSTLAAAATAVVCGLGLFRRRAAAR